MSGGVVKAFDLALERWLVEHSLETWRSTPTAQLSRCWSIPHVGRVYYDPMSAAVLELRRRGGSVHFGVDWIDRVCASAVYEQAHAASLTRPKTTNIRLG